MSCNLAAHAAMRAMSHPDTELNQTDRCVFAWLVYRANGVRKCYKTVEDIQKALNIGTRQTVSASTRKLRQKGLIEVKRRFHDSNHYEILDPDGYLYGDWSAPHVKNSDHVDRVSDVKETALPPRAHVKDSDRVICKEIPPSDVKKSALSPPIDVKKTGQEVEVPQVSTQGRTQGTGLRPDAKARVVPLHPPDIRTQLFREGSDILREMVGMLRSSAGGQISKFLRVANGDCGVVLDAMRAAKREGIPPEGVIGFVTRGVQARSSGGTADRLREEWGLSSLLTPKFDDDPIALERLAP